MIFIFKNFYICVLKKFMRCTFPAKGFGSVKSFFEIHSKKDLKRHIGSRHPKPGREGSEYREFKCVSCSQTGEGITSHKKQIFLRIGRRVHM